MTLIEEISSYQAENEVEQAEKAAFLQFLKTFGENVYTRDNMVGHLTATAWVVNKERTKVLMAYHKLYQSWAWLGGHSDGERDLAAVALREAQEESGIKHMQLVMKKPVDLNVCGVVPHFKRGKYVPRHLHYNLVYLLETDEGESPQANPDENEAVGWVDFGKINVFCKEDDVTPYSLRIIDKIKKEKL